MFAFGKSPLTRQKWLEDLGRLLPAGGDGGKKDHVLDNPRLGGVGDLPAERRVDVRGQSGFLQNFPGGGFRLRLVALHVALGEAPVSAVVPDQQVFPPAVALPPDHRAAGFFLPGFPEQSAVAPTGGQEHPQESEISQLGWFSFPEAAQRVTYASDEEVLLAAEAYLNQN